MKIYNTRTRRSLLMLGGLILTSVSYAQDQSSFSLSEAESYGVNNNEKVKNALLDSESAQKKIWETTAMGLPQVSAEASFQNLIDIPTSVVDAQLFNPMAEPGDVMEFQMGQQYTGTGALNVNQLIFDGSYLVGLKFAKFYEKMSQTALTNTEQEVKVMVREAYYNVLVAKENLKLMDTILTSTQKMWDETRILFDNGFILKTEVNQLELVYNRILAAQQNAIRQVYVAENLLKMQMGFDFEKSLILTETLDSVLGYLAAHNPVLKQFNVSDNPNYTMMNQQKTLDEYSLMNEKAGYYPSVGAFFQHSQNAYRNEFNFFDGDQNWYPTTVWGISVQIPITSSGARLMKVQQAEIKIEQDVNNLSNLERALIFQDMQLKAMYQTAWENMLLEKQNVQLAKDVYDLSIRKKANGMESALQVTQLQNQYLQAEGDYIMSIMDVLSIKIELDKLYNL